MWHVCCAAQGQKKEATWADRAQDTMGRYPRDMLRQPAKPACLRDKFFAL